MRRSLRSILLVVAPALLGALLPACGPAPAAPPAAPRQQGATPPAAKAAPIVAAAAGCPDDLKIGLVVAGTLADESPARFLFEGMVQKLDKIPDSALPQGFDRKDPRAYTSAEHGASADPSRPIPRKLAIELGGSDDDTPVAVYDGSGKPPCMGTLGEFFVVVRAEGWYEPYAELQRRINGCAIPDKAAPSAFAVRASAPLEACSFRAPEKLGSLTFPALDGSKPATSEGRPLPPDMPQYGPAEACTTASCKRAFSLSGVEVPGGTSVYSLSISQMIVNPGDAECDVYSQQRCKYVQSFLLRPAPGGPILRVDAEEADLGGAFVDASGVRYFVSHPRGGMVVHKTRPGIQPQVQRSMQTYKPHPEDSDYEAHSQCPYCGP
ncbi:MAG: hypothetical protein U0359_11885 [Byssovorax sp.]